ncbi:Ig-like domain-containing protein [Shewanella sp. A25]|nr:Ig-like domain-containing protein [Shewanella shenzhenensis]
MKHSALVLLSSLFLTTPLLAAGSSPEKLHTVEGELRLDVEDFQQNATEQFKLHDKQGQVHDLSFKSLPTWVKPGQSVRVFGKAYGKQLQVEDSNISLLQTSGQTTAVQTANSIITPISGNRTLLVAEVNFAINPIVRMTETAVEDLLFNQSAAFFAENSYGAMSLSGDTTSPITVDVDVSVCDTDAIAAAADAELNARGFNLDNYAHLMYLIPTHPKCTWSGKANVAGKRSWIKRVQLSTINHELGHNLGLYHANKKDCGNVTTAETSQCVVSEYGDYLSAMSGTNTPKHFNAFHKEQLGWIAGDQINTLGTDSRVVLSALEAEGNFPHLLKIPNGKDAQGNAQFYYIEYRQALGFDSSLATEATAMLGGVRLREGATNNAASSYLLDPTPNSTSYDWDDISLAPGQVFEQQGVRLEVISSDASSVTLDVSLTGNTCVSANSSLSIQTAITELQQGQQSNVDLLLTNNDSSGCADAVYDFTAQSGTGLSVNLSQNSLSLAPQTSTHLTLSLEGIASNGSDTWQVVGTRSTTNQQLSVAGNVALKSTSSNTAPIAINDSFAGISLATVLNVLANDTDPDGDPLLISGATQGQYGKVTVNADNTLTYTPAKRFKGSDSFSYSITDGSMTSTATVTISPDAGSGSSSVSTDTSTGGKGKNR